jgi:hypothetical protein
MQYRVRFRRTETHAEEHIVGTQLPRVYLARHGETAWTVSRQHTGLTDLPLTQNGERNAQHLG